MTNTSALFRSVLVLSLVAAVAGCAVGSRRSSAHVVPIPGDGGVPLGPDARPPSDVGPRPDIGPIPGVDTDADGLSNADEATRGTNPNVADTDGDGFDDGVEVLAGTNPRDRFSVIPPTDFYVVLPYEDPPVHRELDFRARLGRADVFFLVDTTGSMGMPIDNVRRSLVTTIVPAIEDSIADAAMGVGDFRDYPIAIYGEPGDWPVLIRQTITDEVGLVQTALNRLLPGGGADAPEAAGQGLYVAVADPCPNPDGGFGAACFRPMTHPIVVLVTDVGFHNGPDPINDYVGVPGAHTWMETVDALVEHDVRVAGVGIGIPAFGPSAALPDLRALAAATSSHDSTGAPTVYEALEGAVGTAVVDGIVDLVGAETQDVSSRTADDDTDAVDARGFITAVTPLRATRATSFDATTFYGVAGGTTVTFDVTFQNDFQPATSHVQIYRAYIDVYDVETNTDLDRRTVYVVVPPVNGILF